MAGTPRHLELLDQHTHVIPKRIYRFGPDLLVSFHSLKDQEYAYQLFDLEDLFFETESGFSCLEEARHAAIERLIFLDTRDSSQIEISGDKSGRKGSSRTGSLHQGIFSPR